MPVHDGAQRDAQRAAEGLQRCCADHSRWRVLEWSIEWLRLNDLPFDGSAGSKEAKKVCTALTRSWMTTSGISRSPHEHVRASGARGISPESQRPRRPIRIRVRRAPCHCHVANRRPCGAHRTRASTGARPMRAGATSHSASSGRVPSCGVSEIGPGARPHPGAHEPLRTPPPTPQVAGAEAGARLRSHADE